MCKPKGRGSPLSPENVLDNIKISQHWRRYVPAWLGVEQFGFWLRNPLWFAHPLDHPEDCRWRRLCEAFVR